MTIYVIVSQCCIVYAVDHIVAPSPSNNTRKICIWICAWNNYVSYTLVCVHFIVCSMDVSSCSTLSFSSPANSAIPYVWWTLKVIRFRLRLTVTFDVSFGPKLTTPRRICAALWAHCILPRVFRMKQSKREGHTVRMSVFGLYYGRHGEGRGYKPRQCGNEARFE